MPLIHLKHRCSSIFLALGVCISIIPSCTIVKHYPKDKPFFFENTVNINGKVAKDKKGELKDLLMGQIEDSAAVRTNTEVPWPKFPFIIPGPVLNRPNEFDSVHVIQSTVNMHYFLRNKGYRSNTVSFDSSMKKVKDQYRVKVDYKINTGNVYRLNRVIYALADSNLQRLAMENKGNSFLKKGDPMDYSKVNEEINRLVSLYKNNGYIKISRDDIYVDADSSYRELIDPSIDQFEYLRRLAEIEQKYKNSPQVDLYIRQRALRDTTSVIPYRVGDFTVYADIPATLTTDMTIDTTEVNYNGYKVVSFNNTFTPKFITRFIDLKPGELYKQENFSQTLNNFNRIGAWSNINLLASKVNDSSQTIDYLLKLIPAKKQFFSVDLEGSSVLNTSQLTLVGVGKVGLAINNRLRNRNVGKSGIQLENTLRTGIEFNDFTKIISAEIGLTNRFTIPWLMTPFSPGFEKRFKAAKTIVSLDFSYIDRFQFFKLRTINTFFGYEWNVRQ